MRRSLMSLSRMVSPVKSVEDKRVYRVLSLKNRLEVLIAKHAAIGNFPL